MFISFIILDLVQSRLDLAKKLGADHTLLLSRDSDEKEIVKQVHQLLGKEPDKSIECSGAETSIRIAIQVNNFSVISITEARSQ
jgi:L-iditol 2-dehydrogenase